MSQDKSSTRNSLPATTSRLALRGLFGAASAGDSALFCGSRIVEVTGVATPLRLFGPRVRTRHGEVGRAKSKSKLNHSCPPCDRAESTKKLVVSRHLYPLRTQGEQHA